MNQRENLLVNLFEFPGVRPLPVARPLRIKHFPADNRRSKNPQIYADKKSPKICALNPRQSARNKRENPFAPLREKLLPGVRPLQLARPLRINSGHSNLQPFFPVHFILEKRLPSEGSKNSFGESFVIFGKNLFDLVLCLPSGSNLTQLDLESVVDNISTPMLYCLIV